jgi:RimJ/RimL family protein N-acetyltransferase
MAWPEPVKLTGQVVTIVPLSQSHCADLIEAVKDGELWELWYTFIPTPEKMEAEIERRLKLYSAGSMLPFAVIENVSGKAVGMTTYMSIDAAARRVEIGSTWYRASVQRTALNTECKLLLLTHAFETLECIAVEFRTSYFNQPSRRAIERLGAKLDGIMRNQMRHSDGTLRDTCVYSIISSEWPTVKSHLTYQLEKRQ